MDENWFIFKEDHHLGPFSSQKLMAMFHEQEVSENVLVWKEGFDAWLPMKECAEFSEAFPVMDELPPLPPIPSMPSQSEQLNNKVNKARPSTVDELLDDTVSLSPEDLQPQADQETSERFWSDLDEQKPRVEEDLTEQINPLEYREPEEVTGEVFEESIIEDEGPPPLPPLPVDDVEEEYEEIIEEEIQEAPQEMIVESPSSENEFLFEHTDVYEQEYEEDEDDYEEEIPQVEVPSLPVEDDEVIGVVQETPLSEVEAMQAKREKKTEFLIHSVWAIACLFFITISLYVGFGVKQRKEHFTGLKKADYQRLSTRSKKATSGSLEKLTFDIGVGVDQQSIWISGNRKGPAGLFLSMRSVDQNILGLGPILVTSTSELKEGVAHFDKFDILKGNKFYPGLYEFHFQVFDTSLKHRFTLFLKNIPLLGSLPFVSSFKGITDIKKQVLFWGGNVSEFKEKLATYKKKNKEYLARPIKQRIEAYSTLTNLSLKIFTLYDKALIKMKRGKDILEFEKTYGTQVAPLLQGIILDNIKKQKNIKDQSPKEEKNYNKLIMYGRHVGEFAADIVTETRKIKKLSKKRKRYLTSKFKKTLEKLSREGNSLVSESNSQLKNL
ncbi:MAG: DUF4339 domain-containing protein [Bacteriovoracaceae bacterium]|nr:DUF4339 domain-containing protein [Bacteriovoracaceae bacterium]